MALNFSMNEPFRLAKVLADWWPAMRIDSIQKQWFFHHDSENFFEWRTHPLSTSHAITFILWLSRLHLTETGQPLFPQTKVRNAQLAFQCILNCRKRKSSDLCVDGSSERECVFVYCYFVVDDGKCVRRLDWLVFDLFVGFHRVAFCGMACLYGRPKKISKWKFNEDINSGPWCHKYHRIQGFRCISVNGTASVRRPMPHKWIFEHFLCEALNISF